MTEPTTLTPTIGVSEIDVDRIASAVLKRLDVGPLNLLPEAAASPLSFMGGSGWGDEAQPAYSVKDGIATLRVSGILLQEAFDICGFELATGYDRIVAGAALAFADDTVEVVVQAYDSPGGMAVGNIEAARELRALADEAGKPLIAMVTQACSAAYALASAADEILVIPSGLAGCIGTICKTLDISGAMAAQGVREIVAAWPPGKATQSASAPPEDVRAYMDRVVKPTGDLFIEHVSSRRRMTRDAVFDMQAATYVGTEAVRMGLADAVTTQREAYARLKSRVKSRQRTVVDMGQSDSRTIAVVCKALGINAESSLDDIEKAIASNASKSAMADLGAMVMRETGAATSEDAREIFALYKGAHAALPAAQRELKIRETQLAVSTGRLLPKDAYASDSVDREYPALPALHPDLASRGVAVLRAQFSASSAAPETIRKADPRKASIGRRASAEEISAAKRAGMSEADYLAHLAKFDNGTAHEETDE